MIESLGQSSLFSLPAERFLQTRFHLVSGKGGVGKSSVSLLLGLYFASQGLKTLVCEVDQRGFCLKTFGHDPGQVGGEIKALSSPDFPLSSLYGVNIDFKTALIEYGSMKLKVKSLSSLLLTNPLSQALISLVPGVQDLVAFGKAFHHEREEISSSFFTSRRKSSSSSKSNKKWDRVILDAPATGHGLTFLTLPKLIYQTVPFGNLHKEALEMWNLVSQPHRCTVHVVSLAEELPVQETVELCRSLEETLELKPQVLWTNRLPSSSLSPELMQKIESLQLESSNLHPSSAFHRDLIHALEAQKQSERYFQQLQQLPYAHASIPFLPTYMKSPLKSLKYLLESKKREP